MLILLGANERLSKCRMSAIFTIVAFVIDASIVWRVATLLLAKGVR